MDPIQSPITPRQFIQAQPAHGVWVELHYTSNRNAVDWLKAHNLTGYPVGWPGKDGKITPFALWCVPRS